MTKREIYDVIESVFSTIDNENAGEVLNMVAKERAALDRKNEKAKERAAEKRAAGDELRERVYAVIEEAGEPITVNGILEAMCDSSLTPAKVTARTRQLVAAGVVSKGQVKIDGHKLMAYTLA